MERNYDEPFAPSASDLELELRKLDLSQIGHLFLTYLAESNHGSWEGFEIEHQIGIEAFCADMLLNLECTPYPVADLSFSFGDGIYWDKQGIRRIKQ